ncbi:cytochrome P450 2J4-like isoform X2 [Apodemus sylvaticus]|uniref:cytochrome P450 2J4-like isoform X2 n=1 Tax=Apodemus sylvaticus TaxID=10129 RepID=UPI0022444834|nr:cytochrome P450 2J4-like isoform X2 [Apodemus sylvaticus]
MLAIAGCLVANIFSAIHLWTLLLAALTLLLLNDYLKNKCSKNYPPGPWRLPFVGNLFQFDLDLSHLHLGIQPFVKKYGNLISLDFGVISLVVITGMPLIREAFIGMEQIFMKRPTLAARNHVFKNNGIVFSSGQTWKEQRRFTLTILKNFGLGKKSLEGRIQEEAHHLVEAIGEEKGKPFDPHFRISNAVTNILWSITTGERFEYDDNQFQELLKLVDETSCLEASKATMLYNFFPSIFKYLPGPHQKLFSNWEKLKLFVSRMVDSHKKDLNPDKPRDFIDAFLIEMSKSSDKTTTSYNEENLICSTLDLFFAGTETTSTALRWALLYITACYVEVQKKVHSEIDRVIGRGRQPSIDDRDSMHYTNAVIHEVLRMGNIIPLNVPREVTADSTLAGFHLPKGTIVLANFTALHRDPKEWATPDVFNPEHFLENGQFKKRESFLPFSVGKRGCPGEQLAKHELFIFFTALLQKFAFKPPINEKLSMKFRLSITLSPVSYRFCAVPRQ